MSTNTNRVNNPMKVITGPDTRWSYANVWEPKSIKREKREREQALRDAEYHENRMKLLEK